jgi:FtsP/CotA-like multicopper oxidase with cupredoxin domain
MAHSIDRRSFLLGSAGFSAAAAMASLAPAYRAGATARTTILTVGHRTLEVKGRAAEVFGIVQPNGVSGLTLEPGERFLVDLSNDASEEIIIHWHGQKPPFLLDGFPDTHLPLINDGETKRYDFAATPGTHWMHSHHGLQAQRQMNAPLIVRSAEDVKADRQEITLFLDDFSFAVPEELLAGLTNDPNAGHHGGHGMTMGEMAPDEAAGMDMGTMAMETKPAASGPAIDVSGGMGGMNMGPAAGGTAAGAGAGMGGMDMSGAALDLNDVKFDAFLANDRTLDDPEVVRVERNGRVLLRIINAAASTQFWIDLGALEGTLVAVDGVPVEPITDKRFPMAIAQRLDLVVDVPAGGAFPVLAQVEGLTTRTGIVLVAPGASVAKIDGAAAAGAPAVDLSLEMKLRAVAPLAVRPADIAIPMALTGSMTAYSWSINNQVWPNVTPPIVREGQRVVLDLHNYTGMPHPMHLHGHTFQVIGLNGKDVAGAVRDTVLVPPKASVRIAFDADNPGRWAFHCHNAYHQATGMMTVIAYEGFT